MVSINSKMGSFISTSQLSGTPLSAKDIKPYVDQRVKERKKERENEFKRQNPNWEKEQIKAQQAEMERIKKCTDIKKCYILLVPI